MAKIILSAIITKGLVMASVLYLVLTSSLTDFEKGIIIASVSAFITGVFTVIGAVLAGKMATRRVQPLAEQVEEIHNSVHDVARSVGTDKRETDIHPEESR